MMNFIFFCLIYLDFGRFFTSRSLLSGWRGLRFLDVLFHYLDILRLGLLLLSFLLLLVFVVSCSRFSILGEGLVEANVRWWWALLGGCSSVPENTVPQINQCYVHGTGTRRCCQVTMDTLVFIIMQ